MAQNSNSTMTTIWAEISLTEAWTYRAKAGVSWETVTAELEKIWEGVPHMRWRGFGDAETGFYVWVGKNPCYCDTSCEEESDDEDEEEEEEDEDEGDE
jgi:hypothetical protein